MQSIKNQKAEIIRVLVNEYYSENPAGGSLHITLDDGNYRKKDIEFCLKNAKENSDYWGELIATMLLEFSESEVEYIVETYGYDESNNWNYKPINFSNV
jgi:hypothetical protein